MSARLLILFAVAAGLPGQAMAQPEIITAGDLARPPQPGASDAVSRRPLGVDRNAEAVVILRRCGPVAGGGSQSSRPTGEVHAGASTAGTTQVGGTICLPLGDRGDIVLGGDAVKVDPSAAPRRPGWP